MNFQKALLALPICPVVIAACGVPPSAEGPSGEADPAVTVRSALFETPRFPIAEVPMEVVNVNSEKCMEVSDSGTHNGAAIQQLSCDGSTRQTFFFTAAGPDSYQIRAGHIAGKNVDIQGSSLDNFAFAHLWDVDVVTSSQLFSLEPIGDGSYHIVNRNSGRCLAPGWASPENFMPIYQYSCQGTSDQFWRLRPRRAPLNLIVQHSGKCVDVNGAFTSNGANVQQLSCAEGANQGWYLGDAVQVGTDTYYQVIAGHSGKCLDVEAFGLHDGANVHQWDCHGGDNQLWRFSDGAGDGYVMFINKLSQKCLDVSGVSTGDNANIHQWNCYGGGNQKFRWSVVDQRHVHVVQVAESSGANRVVQDDWAVWQNLARARSVYRDGSLLQLLYDPAIDKSDVNSDALFRIGQSGTYTCPDGSVGTPDACAARYALTWPEKLVIFSRPGGAFGSVRANYLAVDQLPSTATPACSDVPDTQVLARELGHHLGLVDTFRFNGDDRITDTRPDPQGPVCLEPHLPTGIHNGVLVDTNNAMSRYVHQTVVVTPMQSSQARAGAFVRRDGRGLTDPCGGPAHAACPVGQFCNYPVGACTTPDPIGACAPIMEYCPLELVPVCGCDGRTYGNDCEVRAAGVSKWLDGRCSTTGCPSTQPLAGTSCSGALACTYAITSPPNFGCARRFTCDNSVWSSGVVGCP